MRIDPLDAEGKEQQQPCRRRQRDPQRRCLGRRGRFCLRNDSPAAEKIRAKDAGDDDHRDDWNDGVTGPERHLAAERAPKRQPLGDGVAGPERPQEANREESGERLQREPEQSSPGLDLSAVAGLPSAALLVDRVEHDQYAEDRPEQHVLPYQQGGAAQPEPLVRVESPRNEQHERSRDYQRPDGTKFAQPEIDRVVEDLQHEVLPVNVGPAPEVGEARRQQILVLRLGQPKPEQVEHAYHEVEQP